MRKVETIIHEIMSNPSAVIEKMSDIGLRLYETV
jgi:hypothetical protein